MIVALGKTAASNLLGTEASIGSLRGRLHDFHGTPLLVTYHPAYLLRNLPDKAKAWEDLCLARDTMRAIEIAQAAPNNLNRTPRQTGFCARRPTHEETDSLGLFCW